MSNNFNKSWEELTNAEKDLVIEFGSAIAEEAEGLVRHLNGDVETAKQTFVKLRKSVNRQKSVIVAIFAIIGVVFPPVGLALVLYYLLKLKRGFELQRLLYSAYEEFLEYNWNNVAPDRNWGNKISWGWDTFGDVVEKIFGMRGGSAFIRLLQFLWDHPAMTQELRQGLREESERTQRRVEAEVNAGPKINREKTAGSSSSLADKITAMALCIPFGMGAFAGIFKNSPDMSVICVVIIIGIMYKFKHRV